MQPNGGFGGGPGAGPGANNVPPEVWALIGGIILFGCAVGLAIQIFYLLTLSRAFDRCHPDNRDMSPGQVWLNLIPVFGTAWIFVTVIRLSDALRREYRDRRLRGDGDFGRTIGMTYCILFLLGIIPYLGVLFSLAGIGFWIAYWVKVAGYTRELREDDEHFADPRDDPPRDEDDDRDYDDDRDDRRPARRYEDDDR